MEKCPNQKSLMHSLLEDEEFWLGEIAWTQKLIGEYPDLKDEGNEYIASIYPLLLEVRERHNQCRRGLEKSQ